MTLQLLMKRNICFKGDGSCIDLILKELRNHTLGIILVWSLFCLIQVFLGLHFLQPLSVLSAFSVLNQMF